MACCMFCVEVLVLLLLMIALLCCSDVRLEYLLPLLQHEYLHSAPISKVGTPYYTAPEVILSDGEYDGKVRVPDPKTLY